MYFHKIHTNHFLPSEFQITIYKSKLFYKIKKTIITLKLNKEEIESLRNSQEASLSPLQ